MDRRQQALPKKPLLIGLNGAVIPKAVIRNAEKRGKARTRARRNGPFFRYQKQAVQRAQPLLKTRGTVDRHRLGNK
jgi:hypothetical protein